MTTDQPNTQRILYRRTDDRVIGGVASGLGDYFNVDPLLIRIAFVGLMVFNGVGLLLYLGGWLLMPTETGEKSIAARILDRFGLTARGFFLAVLLVIGAGLFFLGTGTGVGYGFTTALGLAIVVIIVGAMIMRRDGPNAAVAAAPVEAPGQPGVSASAVAPPAVAAPAVPRERAARPARPARPPSPLGGYVVGATLAAVGLLALAANALGINVELGQYFGLALGVVGIGLVIGAWWGHARALILLALLILPFAIAASFITVPIEGGFGSHRFSPTGTEELRDEYRLIGGRIRLDLTEVAAGSEPIRIDASVAIGEVFVLLPGDADVELDASVGAGELFVLDTLQAGTAIEDRQVIEGDGTQFVLDLAAGMGGVRIEAAEAEDR